VAVALVVHPSYNTNTDEIRGLLEENVKQILPRSKVS
jgi:hypothetical protein